MTEPPLAARRRCPPPAARRHRHTTKMGGNSPPSTPPVPHFNYDRPARDTFWGYLYALMWALSIAGGVYAIAR